MSFERITKNAISDTFILESNEFFAMMSENSDQKYAYIGISNGEYIYRVKSKSDTTKEYTIKVKIVNDDHSIQDISIEEGNHHTNIEIECECLGYKHRGKCWHSDMIMSAIDNNSYCIMCLTPFLDIQLRNSRTEVNAYDQDGHKILVNKSGSMMIHNDCVIYLGEFESLGEDISNKIQEIYKTFYNKDGYAKAGGIKKYEGIYCDDNEAIDK